MNRKHYIEQLTDYVLDQDHERENTIEDMNQLMEDFTKAEMMERHKNFAFYAACVLRYGKREANKRLNECYQEAVEA